MSAMTNAFEQTILNTMRGIAATAPAAVYVALFLSDPTETGTAGTEADYSGYVRQAMTLSTPTANGTTVSTQNSAQIIFPTPPSSVGTVTHAAICDAQNGGNVLIYKQLDNPIVLTSETSPRFAAGDITLTMAGGNLDPSFKTRVLNYLRGTSITGFEPYLALYNGDPGTGGNELSGTGYARLKLVFDAPEEQTSGQMRMANSNSVQSAAAQNWGTWAYGVIMDAQSGGNRVWHKQNLANYNMSNGARVYVDTGNVTLALN